MPGTFVLKPIEANLTHNTDLITKMNPYCSVVVGNSRIKGEICKKGGKHPHWNDSITVPVANESKALVELMDKDRITHDDNIGSFVVDLNEVQSSGHLSRWYPLTYKNKAAGEILVEAFFQSDPKMTTSAGAVAGKNKYYEQEKILTKPPEVTKKEEVVTTKTTTTTTTAAQPVTAQVVEKGMASSADISKHSNVWTEQRQVIEPHTFIKEVEVVETRPALKEIEVMEPHKVLKEVHYTQAVHVKKQIEVNEPQVVMKEVEVIEPRLVTKTIQVIENVPVIKKVEVVEMRNSIQEVETLEPQTFHKQVEVTEFVPVRKQVEVTQPVTLKKSVEYVEPVITTQIITKECFEPVILNEEITTTVGPASVVGVSGEYGYIEGYGEITISEQKRLSGLQRWIGYELIFDGLTEMERFFEQQRLSRLGEEEWIVERKRLLSMNPKDRVVEQRRLIGLYQKSGGYGYGGGYGEFTISEQKRLSGLPRWIGYESIFDGLNETERFSEQQRLSRLSEEEWIVERKRLLSMSSQDRVVEQRRLIGLYQKTGGYSSYSKRTEVVEKTSVSQGGVSSNIESKGKYSVPTTYHPSPNF